MLDIMLFVVFPYVALAIGIVGHHRYLTSIIHSPVCLRSS
jgi:nitrate reductase gamma subunit